MVWEFGLIILFLIVVAVIFASAFFMWGVKHAVFIALNSILGFFALYAVQAWLRPDLLINMWSILLVAIFGIFGLIFVVIMNLVGVWF